VGGLACAFCIGRLANHAMFVVIHDATTIASFKANALNAQWAPQFSLICRTFHPRWDFAATT